MGVLVVVAAVAAVAVGAGVPVEWATGQGGRAGVAAKGTTTLMLPATGIVRGM